MDQNDDQFFVFVQRLFEQTQSKQLLQTLIDNGFDQWEQTKDLDDEILTQLQIKNEHKQSILTIINDLERKQLPKIQNRIVDTKPLTIDLMQQGLQKKKKDFSKKPPLRNKSELLLDATVLSLNGLQLTGITQCLQMVSGLQILHIYDNKLEQLVLKDFFNLRIVNAQNNLLKLVDIENLQNLEKIYLDKNCLSSMPILPQKLNSISISNQNTKEFQLQEEAFENVSFSLQNIICENSNIEFVLTLGGLQNLEILNLRNNQIREFDDIEDSISQLQSIKEIDLRGNPITSIYKYRDRIVLLCKSIQSIDNKNVLQNERQFLINLGKQKIIKRNQSLEPHKPKVQKPAINGFKEKIHFQDSNSQKLVSKQINSSNNFHDFTPTLMTKHSMNL